MTMISEQDAVLDDDGNYDAQSVIVILPKTSEAAQTAARSLLALYHQERSTYRREKQALDNQADDCCQRRTAHALAAANIARNRFAEMFTHLNKLKGQGK